MLCNTRGQPSLAHHLFLDHFKSGGTLEDFNLVAGHGIFKSKVKDGMKNEEVKEDVKEDAKEEATAA